MRICVLCQNSHSHMSTPSAWKNEAARKLVLSLQVSLESLVCRPCRDDITRMLSNSHYIPRWKKRVDENTKQDEKASCCVLECNNSHFASITSGTAHQISSAFDISGIKCSINPIPVPTPMCKSHYHIIYDTLHSRLTHCVTCGTSLKHTHHRPCPKHDEITRYLRENTGFEGNIEASDRVCYTCYKSHNIILQISKSEF